MTHGRGASLRTAGSIAGAVLLALIALALHPHLVGHAGPQAVLRQMVTLGARDRLVHGTLIVLLGALLTGFASYALRRGLTRWLVVAGLVSFALGICSLCTAGLIDGFVLPELGERFVAASPGAQGSVVATLAACAVAVDVSTVFGFVAMAIAIAAWSLDLVQDRGTSRAVGLAGFVSAALTVAFLVVGGSSLEPHTLMEVVCAQGVWYVWTAASLASRQA